MDAEDCMENADNPVENFRRAKSGESHKTEMVVKN